MNNLDEYITKADAIEAIRRERDIRAIADLPSADVIERKRGKWIKKKHYRICPFCEATMIDSGFDDFCPHCGADMRGK